MPFMCTPRVLNSISAGEKQRVALQITDLHPHKTQSNPTLTPNPKGPVYLYAHGRDLTEEVAVNGDFATTGEFSGLAAYFLTTVEDTTNAGISLTPARANALALAVISRMETGLSLTLEDINAEIAIVVGGAGSDLDGTLGDSTGSVEEVLQIVSGYKVYTVPALTDVEDAVNFVPLAALVQAGFFSDPSDASKLWNDFANHPSFWISAKRGQLRKAQERTVDGVASPYVVIYADDGSLYI